MVIKHYTVYGRVQGVGFRYFTWKTALKIGVKGWVRNLSDGSVSVIAQGTEEQLIQLKNWLQQGPKSAQVERVLEQDYIGEKTFTAFEIGR